MRTIPARIEKDPSSSKNLIVLSLEDVLEKPSALNSVKEIENEFDELIRKIKSIMMNKPSSTPRKDLWRIGAEIRRFRERTKKEHKVYITNLIEAVAKELNLSENFIRYLVKFSEFILKRQVDEKIPWSTYMEALNLSNKEDFQRCIWLIKEGKLRSSKDVRKYVRAIKSKRV